MYIYIYIRMPYILPDGMSQTMSETQCVGVGITRSKVIAIIDGATAEETRNCWYEPPELDVYELLGLQNPHKS